MAHASSGKDAIASIQRTWSPLPLSILAPIGATGMGRHGAKKRAFEKGHKSATPSPPSVMASDRVGGVVHAQVSGSWVVYGASRFPVTDSSRDEFRLDHPQSLRTALA